jgi:hypothetical protein
MGFEFYSNTKPVEYAIYAKFTALVIMSIQTFSRVFRKQNVHYVYLQKHKLNQELDYNSFNALINSNGKYLKILKIIS